jgi:hypothetical protein
MRRRHFRKHFEISKAEAGRFMTARYAGNYCCVRGHKMRSLFRFVVCLAIAGMISGCSEVNYFRQGIGTDVYSSELPNVTALNDVYIALICRQAGLANEGETCDTPTLGPYWTTFVQAGMNDIDRRCDAYLAWLDDRKRSQTPVLNELHALSAATIGIMNATGVGANPITIVGLAFGLAADTFTNVQSRLVLEANHSTVQAVVLGNQSQYRREVIGKVVDNKPAAIYLLRGYLRICMPFSIETSINDTLTVYHRSGAGALDQYAGIFQRPALIPSVSQALRQSIPSSSRAPLQSVAEQPGGPPPPKVIGSPQTAVENKMPIFDGRQIQGNLCVSAPDGNFGTETREAIRQAKLAANMSRAATRPLFKSVNNQISTNEEAQIFLDAKHCELDRSGTNRAYATAFEKFRFADENAIKDLQRALAKCDSNVKQTGIFDKATRDGILAATGMAGSTVGKTDRLNDKSYAWVSGACI